MKRIRFSAVVLSAALAISMLLLTSSAAGKEKEECREKAHSKGHKLTREQIMVLKDFLKAHRDQRQKHLEKMLIWDQDLLNALEQIDLTKDQEDALIKIVSSREPLFLTYADPITKDGIALKNSIVADNVKDKTILDSSAKLAKDIGESAIELSKMVKEARQTLTPEQWAVVEDLIKKGQAEGNDILTGMPKQVEDLIALWGELDLTREQIDYLIGWRHLAERIQENLARRQEHRIWHELRRILTHEQMKMVKAYVQPREEEMEKKQHEEIESAVKLYYDLGLSQEQMDRLFKLVEDKKAEIIKSADEFAGSGFKLRDEVLAQNPDPAKMRAAAKLLGDDLGKASLLKAEMVKQARQILTPEQFNLILAKVDEVQAEIEKGVKRTPEEINAGIKLWDQLNLTPAQKQKLKKLIKHQIREHEHMVKRMMRRH